MLDNLGEVYAWDYLRYWPAVLVIYGVAKLFEPHASRFWSGLFILVGSLLLLDRLYIIDFDMGFVWPLLIIAVGGTILWSSLKRVGRVSSDPQPAETSGDAFISVTAVMGGFERIISSKEFRGGNVTAIMGGCDLDLRKADIKGNEAVLDVLAIWGGVELKVPDTWTVLIEGVPVMGGFSDETKHPQNVGGKRLIIKGTAIMGGLEVKN